MKATAENILSLVNTTNQHLAGIEASLFEVVKIPLVANNEDYLPNFFKAPIETYGIYKTNGGQALGVMKEGFTPMQPKEFFDNIIETVHEFGADLDLNTLKFKQFNGGARIEFSIKMFPISFKNDKGINDITNLEVTFATSYNGTKSNTISLYTERLVCLNGMVASKLQGVLKGRNTKGGKSKILSYGEELAQIINGATEFKEKMIALDKIKVNKKQIEAYKETLFGYNQQTLNDSDKKENTRQGILDAFEEALTIEFARTGETAFGLLQATTYYTNHLAKMSNPRTKTEVTRDEYIRFNQGFKTNEKAQEILFAMLD